MKALVLGAGLAGVTTAYELLKDGWQVEVVDREQQPAMLTSYANAGLFAPGHAYAWSSPAAPKILLRSLWRNDQALRFKPSLDPALWSWMVKFLGQCTAERAAINTSRKAKLCSYSQEIFHANQADQNVDYDGNTGGLIFFYRTPEAFEAACAKSNLLSDNGVEIERLDAAGVVAKDPALESFKSNIAGALYSPNDESGDAHKFTQELGKVLQARGVTFHWETDITGIKPDGDQVSAITTNKGDMSADIFVLCLGVYAPHLARHLGVNLPIYPVKGYSVTVPVAGRNNPPTLGGVDEENLVAYCPMGERMRVTATAEFSGYDRNHSPADFRHMLNVVKDLFPDAADYSKPDYWAGLRPMTPEGSPIFGRARHQNFWYNTGLGHMGWTMSHGGARITADLIAGNTPEIDLDGMLLH
ncbi:MAG: FAD-dependent oxidoreductase [Alphaproteobacteria bacterium]|nr:FAD-dependent oxidoreductase [Alphaproteobacteria bacterium]